MHGMHARLPKNFVLEERLERYAQVIELEPTRYAGSWAEACSPLCEDGLSAFRHVHMDLGCGKGAYVVAQATAHPDTLYLALDAEPICVAYTAQHVMEAGLGNVVVVPALGSSVARICGQGELDAITLNFPTPFPRKKEADKRLTIIDRLLDYRKVLAKGGVLRFKTDSYPLWRFTLTQLELARYQLLWDSEGAWPGGVAEPRLDDTPTEYERRLTAQGARVYALEATPGPTPDGWDPAHVEQTASLSLVDYLPDDLEQMGYVPHGMQGTVTNLRNRHRHQKGRRGCD